MFVIGRSPGGSSFLSDVEVIDLADPNSTCDTVDYYPVKDGSMAVGLVNGLVKSCGGYHDTYQCFD